MLLVAHQSRELSITNYSTLRSDCGIFGTKRLNGNIFAHDISCSTYFQESVSFQSLES